MNKYVIYNPETDTYLKQNTNTYVYTDEVNDATIFTSLEDIWLFLESNISHHIEPVILKVDVEVIPDHTINYYDEKMDAMLEAEKEIERIKQRKIDSLIEQANRNIAAAAKRYHNDPLGQR